MTTINAKRQNRIIKAIDLATRTIRFSNSELTTLEPIVICLDSLSHEIQLYAALAGIGHKVGDAAAMDKDPATGKSATPEVKWAAMQAMCEQLLSGSWNKTTRDSSGSREMAYTKQALLAVKAKVATDKGLVGDAHKAAMAKVAAWFDNALEVNGAKAIQAMRNQDIAWNEEYNAIKERAEGKAKLDSTLMDELDNLI